MPILECSCQKLLIILKAIKLQIVHNSSLFYARLFEHMEFEPL